MSEMRIVQEADLVACRLKGHKITKCLIRKGIPANLKNIGRLSCRRGNECLFCKIRSWNNKKK